MSFTNFEYRHLSEIEKFEIDNLLIALEMILSSKIVYLSLDETQELENDLPQDLTLVNKINEYIESMPHLSNPDIDWIRFKKNYETSIYHQRIIKRMTSLLQGINNVKLLYNHNNYQIALLDYEYAYRKSITSPDEFKAKYEVLKSLKSNI